MTENVPLNSEQARVMLEAFQYERDRIRYELNWPANAEASRANRIRKIEEAVELGVPLRQVQVFIWGEKYFA